MPEPSNIRINLIPRQIPDQLWCVTTPFRVPDTTHTTHTHTRAHTHAHDTHTRHTLTFCFFKLHQHHTTVIQAVMLIFKSLGLKCIPFLPQIMPPFLQCMRTKETILLKFLFKQLGLLVAIVKQHIRVRPATRRDTAQLMLADPPITRLAGLSGRDLFADQGVLGDLAPRPNHHPRRGPLAGTQRRVQG